MIELLCIDVDGTLTDGSLVYGYSLCGNLSLGMQFAPFSHKTSLDEPLVLSRSFHAKTAQSHTANTSIVLNTESKSESSLRGESQDSPKQSTIKSNPCDSTKSRPLRGAKNRIQGCSSATADFLLEAEKRGSPPKSEKRQLLARRGSGAGGAALLRKETSESSVENDEKIADTHAQITEIAKVFNVKDGLALAYWRKILNRKVAIITGKGSEILRIRASELQIPSDLLFMNVRDKGKVVRELKQRFALESAQIASVGDDLNDISMFAEASLNFAPNDCASTFKTSAKNLPKITILNAKGGEGAVREAIELILQKEKLYEKFIQYWQ